MLPDTRAQMPKIVKPPAPKITSRSGSEPKAVQYYQPPAISPASINVLLGMGLVAPSVAKQFLAAGLKYSVADTMQVAGGGRGPAANYNVLANTVYYNPRHARTESSYRGTMEGELVHAATSLLPGISNDPRYQYLYGVDQAIRGRINPSSIRAVANREMRPQTFALSEGLAHRGSAYPGIPQWGDEIRRTILGR